MPAFSAEHAFAALIIDRRVTVEFLSFAKRLGGQVLQ
jgi:hypothetical protein